MSPDAVVNLSINHGLYSRRMPFESVTGHGLISQYRRTGATREFHSESHRCSARPVTLVALDLNLGLSTSTYVPHTVLILYSSISRVDICLATSHPG